MTQTALHLAANVLTEKKALHLEIEKLTEISKLLVIHGAALDSQDSDGKTPVNLAPLAEFEGRLQKWHKNRYGLLNQLTLQALPQTLFSQAKYTLFTAAANTWQDVMVVCEAQANSRKRPLAAEYSLAPPSKQMKF